MMNSYWDSGSCGFAYVGSPTRESPPDTLINDLHRSHKSKEEIPPLQPSSKSLIKEIGYELFHAIESSDIKEIDPDDIKPHKDKIEDVLGSIREVVGSFQSQIDLVKEKEDMLKKSINQTQESLHEIKGFTRFLDQMKDHGDTTNEIQHLIVNLTQSLHDKDTTQELKRLYEKELDILQVYVDFIKTLNGLNIGSTCPLCLQMPVTQYMNPCGHTGCDECLRKIQITDQGRSSCFLCRKPVISLHKLFFC
jgi:hypothetical protein